MAWSDAARVAAAEARRRHKKYSKGIGTFSSTRNSDEANLLKAGRGHQKAIKDAASGTSIRAIHQNRLRVKEKAFSQLLSAKLKLGLID